MDTIGSQLRTARQRKKCSLEDAAKATKIKADLLSAFEADDFPKGTAPIYLKSHLKNYGDFLGLEGRALAEQYVRQYGDGNFQPPMIESKDVASAPSKLSLPLVGAGAIIFVLVLAFFTRHQWTPWLPGSGPAAARNPGSPPVAGKPRDFFVAASFLNELIPLPGPSATSQKHNLRLQASEQSYVKVIADDVKVFDDQLLKGQQKEFSGKQFHLFLGHASGVAVYYDGKIQTSQGREGDRWERDWPPKPGAH